MMTTLLSWLRPARLLPSYSEKKPMRLRLERTVLANDFTLGEFYINDMFHYFTVEDCVRKEKVKGKTAIPAGKYAVVITHSQRFGKRLPLLLDVPNFEGIRIHAGNTQLDTEGCILIGMGKYKEGVTNSRKAMDDFMPKLEQALSAGEDVWIEVV